MLLSFLISAAAVLVAIITDVATVRAGSQFHRNHRDPGTT